jgi:glutamyl-Q tRNA(Asp) synthetase
MEDLDTARVIPGCADRMLHTLEQFGLHWDGEVVYQSRRIELYAAAARQLESRGLTYPCGCSRRDLTDSGDVGYPGTCRHGPARRGPHATRFRIDDSQVVFFRDRIQQDCRFEMRALGDFVAIRKDGVFSYQLAVVVDDAEQHVSDVVRGADLLQSTAWQIALQRALNLPAPRYAHLPLVVEEVAEKPEKLAKSRRSVALDPHAAGALMSLALRLLNHPPPEELERAAAPSVLEWAIRSWNPGTVRGLSVAASPHPHR